jgi:shikimate kinase
MKEPDAQPGDFELERIFLVGFMGCGKTTVGRVLAARLGRGFRDLDDMIEASAGKSVRAIFSACGESGFRGLESNAIESCGRLSRVVIALGGGAYASEENRAKLRWLGKTIWLDCSLEECLRRVKGDPRRPLLGSLDEMKLLFESRRAAYASADLVVDSGDAAPEAIAEVILERLSDPDQKALRSP